MEPEPIIHHHLIDRLAFANGVVSGIALYPQVWTVLRRGPTGISALTYMLILANSLVWIIYSLHRRLISLGIASVLNAVASILLLMAILI